MREHLSSALSNLSMRAIMFQALGGGGGLLLGGAVAADGGKM